jgi:ParB-like chromosome segregation protein Spo0J
MARTKLVFALPATGTEDLDLKPGTATVAVASIQPRREGNARPLSAAHVVTLAESIAALGVLEPPVIDTEGHLLAGAHRLAALLLLLAEGDADARRAAFLQHLGKSADDKLTPEVERLAQRVADLDAAAFAERYPRARVPVLVIDTADKDLPALDLAVETAENSVRRQYSIDEVKALAVRLKKAGYTDRQGRPKKGEKSARVVLEALLGCSTRHVQRLLGETEAKTKSDREKAEAAFRRAANRVLEVCTGDSEKAKALRKAAEEVIAALPDKKA